MEGFVLPEQSKIFTVKDNLRLEAKTQLYNYANNNRYGSTNFGYFHQETYNLFSSNFSLQSFDRNYRTNVAYSPYLTC